MCLVLPTKNDDDNADTVAADDDNDDEDDDDDDDDFNFKGFDLFGQHVKTRGKTVHPNRTGMEEIHVWTMSHFPA